MTIETNAQNGTEGIQTPAGEGQQDPNAQGNASVQTNGSDEGIVDQHGQPGISAAKYEREKKAWEAKEAENKAAIEELQKQLSEFKATEDAKAEFEKQINDLKAEQAAREVEFKLELAGCKSTKAAKALLSDYENDIDKLKEAAPYLFEARQTGATGLPPAGASTSELERKNAARKAAGLPPITTSKE